MNARGGDDILNGGAGSDTLQGGDGVNILSGDEGNDFLSTGFGSDTLLGGAGDDLILANGFGNGTAVVDGGDGVDSLELRLSSNTSGILVDTAAWASSEGVTLANGTVIRNMEQLDVRLGSGDDLVRINSAIDGRHVFFGEGGVNRLEADFSMRTQNVSFNGSSVQSGDLIVSVRDFAFVTMTSGSGNDDLFGSFTNDVFSTGLGNDVVWGNGGDDTLSGGLGDDDINGGDGIDTAAYDDATGAVRVYLAFTTAQNTLASGFDTLVDIENVTGSAFSDTLVGTTGANVLEGGAGDDILNGLGGLDTASYVSASAGVTVSLVLRGAQNTGGAGADQLYGMENLTGSAFNDALEGSAGANVLAAGAGNDFIMGWAGADTIDGGAGDDTLNGGNGNDVIAGGDGNDAITDNSGPVVSIDGGAGDDVITAGFFTSGSIAGGTGADQLNGAGSLYLLDISGIETLNTNGQRIIATAAQMEAFDTIRRAANLPGSVVNLALSAAGTVDLRDELLGRSVTFTGTTGTDIITSSDGNDTISGLGGHDIIDGGARNDVLNGDAGNDTLIGGLGNDQLNGGDGSDTASYATASTGVTVSLAITTAQATGGAGSDTFTSIENLLGSAHTDMLTGDAGVNRLQGGGGDDTLNGGLGADLLSGGGGNDLILHLSTDGRDIIDGGAGADTYRLTGTAEAETFRILTRAEAEGLGITGLAAGTEIVITRNGTTNAAIIAELDNIEEIEINSLVTTANNGNGTVDGGAAGGDTIIVAGDFTTTSLNYSTITIHGSTDADTIDITGLSSDHRIVFDSNGGADTVIGAPRPQDVFNGVSSFGASDGLGALASGIHQFGDLLRETLADDFQLDFLLDQRSPAFGIVQPMDVLELSFQHFAPLEGDFGGLLVSAGLRPVDVDMLN